MGQFEPKRKKSGGRKKGTPNKTTSEIKDMIVSLVGNQMQKWPAVIDKMMKENPVEAMKITGRLIDYVLPKQTKVDLQGELNHNIQKIVIEINKSGSKDEPRN